MVKQPADSITVESKRICLNNTEHFHVGLVAMLDDRNVGCSGVATLRCYAVC